MINKQKGTYDLYGKKANELLELNSAFEEFMRRYNYKYIRTPLYEATELFHRSSGETSDVVTKETYDFTDRGDRNITLRPEGTAGVVRAYIENKMYVDGMKKLWYFGPMYRYERPQKGRFREHYQFGCEVFGSDDPALDAEIISIPSNFLAFIGLEDIKVNINTLGDRKTRDNYRNALVEYLKPYLDNLCDDCKNRFEKNPLRILDCKADADSDILKNAPKITDYLTKEAEERFNKVLSYLNEAGIPYEVNPNIVRGLDYYSHTVFEIEYTDEESASKVLCAGGRYNNLVKELGGPDTPAIGFGMGSERVLEILESLNIELSDEDELDCYVIPLSENEKQYAISLTETLRFLGMKADMDYLSKSLKSNLKTAEDLNATFALIVGEDELKNNYITVRDMVEKEEEKVPFKEFIPYLTRKLSFYNNPFNFACSDDCDCGCECDCDCDCDCECECECECTCDDDCTCGCKDGKECTCHDEKCTCKEK